MVISYRTGLLLRAIAFGLPGLYLGSLAVWFLVGKVIFMGERIWIFLGCAAVAIALIIPAAIFYDRYARSQNWVQIAAADRSKFQKCVSHGCLNKPQFLTISGGDASTVEIPHCIKRVCRENAVIHCSVESGKIVRNISDHKRRSS